MSNSTQKKSETSKVGATDCYENDVLWIVNERLHIVDWEKFVFREKFCLASAKNAICFDFICDACYLDLHL